MEDHIVQPCQLKTVLLEMIGRICYRSHRGSDFSRHAGHNAGYM